MLQAGDDISERFEVERLIGEGGLAQVYRVRHRSLGTVHAVKLLTNTHPQLVERLLQEGRIQARLQHVNIVAVTDVVIHRGQPGLLMEFLDCESLEEALARRGPPPLEDALDLFASVLAGVASAHRFGVLHRDLKPANVLLARTPGGVVPKVADFGIAKVAAGVGGPSLTRVGVTMGTPGYMAPEQSEDARRVDARADVFSLGAILYEITTGKRAFPSNSVRTTLNATATGSYPPPEDVRPELPSAICEAIRRALQPKPEDRFPDCPSFAAALFADRPELLARADAPLLTPPPLPVGDRGPARPSQPTWGSLAPGTNPPETWATGLPSGGDVSSETLAPVTLPEDDLAALAEPPAAPTPSGAPSPDPAVAAPLPLEFKSETSFPAENPPRQASNRLLVALALAAVALGGAGLAMVGTALQERTSPPEEALSLDAPLVVNRTARVAGAEPEEVVEEDPVVDAAEADDPPGVASSPPEDPPPSRPKPASSAPVAAAVTATPASAPEKTPSKSAQTAAASTSPSPAATAAAAAWTPSPSPATDPAPASDSATIPDLRGSWAGEPWTVTIQQQDGVHLTGFIYRGGIGSSRIPVVGRLDPDTGKLSLQDGGPARYVLTGTVRGSVVTGTYTQGTGKVSSDWSARRSN